MFTPEIEAIFIAESSIYSPSSETNSSINVIFQTSLNDSIYIIITNIIQTTEKKDNKVAEKTNDPRSNLNIKKQLKDPRNNLKITKKNIGLIPDPDLDID